MGSLALLVRRNLRKSPGQSVILVVLIVLAAALLNIGAILTTAVSANYDAKASQLNAEDAVLATADPAASSQVKSTLGHDARVHDTSFDQVRGIQGTFAYGGSDFNTLLVVSNVDADPGMGRSHIVERSDQQLSDPIYLPYLFKTGGGYALGDEFVVTTPSRTFKFQVAGFFENLFLGTINMGLTGVAVPAGDYAALSRADSGTTDVQLAKLQAKAGEDVQRVLSDTLASVNTAAGNAGQPAPWTWSLTRDTSKSGATLTSGLFSASFVLFAVIVAAVTVIVIRFLVRNYVTRSMPAIGTQKATGFTSSQIMWSLTIPYLVVAVVGVAAGIGLSYVALPSVAAALAAQSGLTGTPGVSAPALGVTAGVLLAAVLVAAMLSARAVRVVTPDAALRGGGSVKTGSKRNQLPLATTAGNLHWLLGVKQTLQNLGQAATVALVIALVTFTSTFSIALYQNVLGDETAFRHLAAGDTEDVTVTVKPTADRDALLRQATATAGVRKAFYRDVTAATASGYQFALLVSNGFMRLDYDNVYEGRQPAHDNEVAIGGRLAELTGAEPGTMLNISMGGRSSSYLVVGLLQSTRGMGLEAHLTQAGVVHLDPHFKPTSLAIYLTEGASADAVMSDLKREAGSQLDSVIDTREYMDSQLGVYSTISGGLAVVILALTGAVVALVIGLVATTMITQGRRGFGIKKAVGFTTAELQAQTVAGYLPQLAAGAVIGGVAGFFLANPMLAAALRTAGIMRLDFQLSPWLTLGLITGVVAFGLLITWLMTLRIRRISAYSLITE